MAERDKIVAYLRGRAVEEQELADGIGDPYEPDSVQALGAALALSDAANNIENGLHLTFKPEPTIPFETWRDKPSAR